MSAPIVVQTEMPAGWEKFRLPEGLHRRLQELLDNRMLEAPSPKVKAKRHKDGSIWPNGSHSYGYRQSGSSEA